MEGEGCWEQIKAVARSNGVVDIAVASAESWNTDSLVSGILPEGSRPTDILPNARSVIVIVIPIQKTIVDTTPSIYYHELYKLTNSYLDLVAERIVLELSILGHDAVFVPRDGYHGRIGLENGQNSFFSHRHAAYLAGMGTIGLNNMVLTEKYGPRIRITSVITSAQLPSGKPLSRQICTNCGLCMRECPAAAVRDGVYPEVLVDKSRCIDYASTLAKEGISPCGKCIAVCPVGKDRMPSPNEEAVRRIQSYKLVNNRGN